MSQEIHIEIPGKPVPRYSRKRDHYTPPHITAWKEQAKILAIAAMRGRKPLEGAVAITYVAVFGIPKSWPKWKKETALNGVLFHSSKPDTSNILKNAEDAFNGIVYRDDAQICRVAATKLYGEKPMVSVVVQPMEGVKG